MPRRVIRSRSGWSADRRLRRCWLLDRRASPHGRCEAEQVPVGIGHTELSDTGFLVVDAVPRRLERHEEHDPCTFEPRGDRRGVRHRDLEVDPAAERMLERAGDPVTSRPRLIEHHVRGTEGEGGEALVGSCVPNGEATELHPERETDVQVRDEELGYERGIEVGSHTAIIAPEVRPDGLSALGSQR